MAADSKETKRGKLGIDGEREKKLKGEIMARDEREVPMQCFTMAIMIII